MPWSPAIRVFGGKFSRLLRKHRIAVVCCFALCVVGVTQLAWFQNFIPLLNLEQAFIDFRFRLRGRIPASPQIAIVGINTSSMEPGNLAPEDVARSEALQLMQEGFPWNRKVYALLLEKLVASGARTVVMDLAFAGERAGDAELAAVLQKYQDRVVIASLFSVESPESRDRRQIYQLPNPALLPTTGPGIVGYVTFWPEIDGVIRRVKFRTSELREAGYESPDADLISLSALAVEKFAGVSVPSSGASSLINFQGPQTTYPYLPIEEIFMDRIFAGSRQFEFGKVFAGKLVFVGAIAELAHDIYSTPYGLMPGVEIHAQIAGSLLQNSLLREPPDWVSLVLTVGMAALAAFVSLKVPHAVATSGFLAGGVVLFVLAAQLAFVRFGSVLPMAAPLAGFAATGLFGLVFDFLLEELERARVRSVLDRYVPKNVAALVLAEGDTFDAALRGRRRYVTALFSDIRGFTPMTESANPEDLIAQLNEYFFQMVEAVLAEDGTLQQFVGDAIMAVWGDTHAVSREQGAYHAVRTALRMRAALDDLNRQWADNPARREFKIGIGIGHGEAIVGTLGHPLRMRFSVVGDGINTAARLQTATKHFGCTILVGEAVESLTRDRFHYRRVDFLKLVGKARPIEVFTPLSEISTPPPAWLADYHRAIDLYRSRNFYVAAEIFRELAATLSSDTLCTLYAHRCQRYIATSPPTDWDGSHELTEK